MSLQILTEHSLTDLMIKCHQNPEYRAAIIFNRLSDKYKFITEFKRMRIFNDISGFVIVPGTLGGHTSIIFDNDSYIDILRIEDLRTRGRLYNDFLLEESVAIRDDCIQKILAFTREYQLRYQPRCEWEMEYYNDFIPERDNKEMDDFLNSFKIYSSS